MHRLRLEEAVGEGAFSVVYRATTTGQQQEEVAVKLFRKRYSTWQEACSIQEIKTLLVMRGRPHVVQVHEFGREDDGLVFFVTDMFHGSLHQLLLSHPNNRLSERDTSTITQQLLRGLDALHSCNIVHRDVKPENILYRQQENNNNGGFHIVVADFGSSAVITPRSSSNSHDGEKPGMGDYVTTRFYRSPEMVFKDRAYGAMVDVWAVGCIVYESLCGQPLFPATGEADLLFKMCSVLGSPNVEGDEGMRRMCTSNFDPRCIPKHLPPLLPVARWWPIPPPSPEAAQCVAAFVRWVPESRLDCRTALRQEPFLRM